MGQVAMIDAPGGARYEGREQDHTKTLPEKALVDLPLHDAQTTHLECIGASSLRSSRT